MIIDSHAHLYLSKTPLDTLAKEAKKQGVSHIINIGINIETSLIALEQHLTYPSYIYPTIGIHPGETQDIKKIPLIKNLVTKHPFVALGEMGLDYYKMYAPKNIQWTCFEQQLELAAELNMPVIIHNRHADTDIKAITDNFPQVKKVLHCFSSPWEFAESMITDNTYFSFTGQITYAKKGKTVRTLKELPIDKIMIETDSPYLTPKSKQGHPNQPAYTQDILEHIITLRKEDPEEIKRTLFKTTCSFFNIS